MATNTETMMDARQQLREDVDRSMTRYLRWCEDCDELPSIDGFRSYLESNVTP